LREDAQKLKEEKSTLEGMIQSHDELIMEMAEEYGLNRMGETMMMMMRMRMMTTKGMPSHHMHLRLLPCLRRSSKKKPPWRMVHRSWMIWMTWMI
jgi:hypothetical protein